MLVPKIYVILMSDYSEVYDMFDKIKAIFKNKNPDSTAYKYDKAKALSGRAIRYVTERIDNVDEVVGRAGALNLKDDEFIVLSDFDIQFRCKVEDMTASDLMSLDGVVLSGHDLEHGGEYRTIIAYYTYYR